MANAMVKYLQRLIQLLLTSEPSREKRALTIALSVLIATLLWGIVTLNQVYTPTFVLPVKIVGIPDSLHLTELKTDQINIRVSGLGLDLIWGNVKLRKDTVQIPFSEVSEGQAYLSSREFAGRVEDAFTGTVKFQEASPLQIELAYEAEVKKEVPVIFNAELRLKPSYQLERPPQFENLFVTLYGPPTILDSLESWPTEPDLVISIDQQTRIDVPLASPPPGIHLSPKSVTIPVKPQRYTEAKLEIPIKVTGIPEELEVRKNVEKLTLSCLIPARNYRTTLSKFRDYSLNIPFNQLDPQVPYLIPSLDLPDEIKLISKDPRYLSFVIIDHTQNQKFSK